MTSLFSAADDRFREQYGPWAVIAGASEGTGAEYARKLAARGLNLFLIARRPEPLEALADSLHREFAIDVRTLSLDLSQPAAAFRILAATVELEVGLYVSNAGSDTASSLFLDAPIADWLALIQRNVTTTVEACYGFAKPMRERGRGGMILMSSGTALGGGKRLAVYSASKAFDMNFAESLWAELGEFGVNVLSVVAPGMSTPQIQRMLERKGLQTQGLFDPAQVVETALNRLEDGPTVLFPFGPEADTAAALSVARRERILEVTRLSAAMFFGDK
ncbi:MAG: short-chain dehydrogenase [Verrucomicrobiaceae bacterium]|nr:short-chain dehydrogenase [Verrucomicrobiaceae bacterium]